MREESRNENRIVQNSKRTKQNKQNKQNIKVIRIRTEQQKRKVDTRTRLSRTARRERSKIGTRTAEEH